MINLVIAISERAKNLSPDFLIIPQNALKLVEDPYYLNAIDGVGKEDTWYLLNNPRPRNLIQEDLRYLEKVFSDNKIVLLIDYPTDLDKIRRFFQEAGKYGYVAYVGPLELDKVGFYQPP